MRMTSAGSNSVFQHFVKFDPALLEQRMLLGSQFGVFGTVLDFLESLLRSRERIKPALPDDRICGFAAGYWCHALTARENAAMLQFSELFLQSVKLLFVGRKVLLNKTQNNGHDFLLRK
jgi:hypothetical protein